MSLIAIAFGLAGLLLVITLLMRGGAFAGCLAVLLAASCFGHSLYFVPTYPVPMTADRVLVAGLGLQYLIAWRLGRLEARSMRCADWLLAGLVGVVLYSTFTHDWRFKDNQPASLCLFCILIPAAMYWVARQGPVTRRHVAWLLAGLAAFGLYLSFTAYCEVQSMWSAVFPRYIADGVKYPEYFGRGRGPYLDPTANGVVLTACAAAAALAWPHLGRRGQLMLLLAAPIYGAGLFYTLTRSVWIGATAAVVVTAGLCVPRVWRWRLVATAGLVALVAVSTSWERLVSFKRDRHVSAAEVADSVQLRPILAVVAWQMFQDRPLLGCGYGQYEPQAKFYLGDRSSGLPLEKARPYVQHNTFLSLLTQIGAMGLGLFVGLLGLLIVDAWRLWRQAGAPLWARQVGLLQLATLAAYVANAMFHDMLLTPTVTMLWLVLAGAIASLRARFATGGFSRELELRADVGGANSHESSPENDVRQAQVGRYSTAQAAGLGMHPQTRPKP